MSEKKRVVERGRKRLIYRTQCKHFYPNGRRCRNRCWAGKGFCFQHDPEAAELRAKAQKPNGPVRLMTVVEIQALLSRTMGELQEGRITPREVYATGYLAQLALTAMGVAKKVNKLDVKHFWEMVDLGATAQRAVELAEERRIEAAEKEKREAESAKEAKQADEADGSDGEEPTEPESGDST